MVHGQGFDHPYLPLQKGILRQNTPQIDVFFVVSDKNGYDDIESVKIIKRDKSYLCSFEEGVEERARYSVTINTTENSPKVVVEIKDKEGIVVEEEIELDERKSTPLVGLVVSEQDKPKEINILEAIFSFINWFRK